MIHLAVFLITLSGLVFEIGLTRIYSATIWYHFTFIAVSVALLGWGLGGLAVHLLKRGRTLTLNAAAACVVGYAAAIPLCLWAVVTFPFTIDRLPLYFVAPLVPFFLAGMALSIIFDRRKDIAGSLYFADLVGASLGAVIITLLLQTMGAESSLLVAAIAPCVAAVCLSAKARIPAGALAVVLVGLAASNGSGGWLKVVPGELKAMHKHMIEVPGTHVTQTGWNAYSRIDTVEGFPAPNLARLYIDSDAWTNAHQWDGRLESISDLKTWYRALPFQFETHPDTLVIGPGGGSDVLVALSAGSKKVTAVELNPLMIEFVRHYGAMGGNIYNRPDVEVVLSEGRSFISRTDRQFDVIFLGFVDSWASVASGGLSLSENYLYTTEAFRAYYDHLNDDGVLAILRWDADIPRLVANAVALLGVQEAAKRVVVIMEKPEDPKAIPQMIFMLRKQPFTETQTAAIMNDWTLARPVIVPGRHADAPYDALFAGQKSLQEIVDESSRRVGPVFDDSPFYFAVERPWGMATKIAHGLMTLVAGAAALLAGFIIFGRPIGGPLRPYASSVVYFAALAAGFIAVELALLQNLTLLIGHPIFTLSVLLFTLLAASGIGASMSARLSSRTACLLVAGIGAAGAIALPRLVPVLLPFSFAARVAAAVVLIAPLGLAMGMPFPQGLRKTGRGSLPAPPFYWGLNGVMSVIGSVATVTLAVLYGFTVAMLAGSACYVVAALVSTGMDV
jgi:Spermine/spermidine synthase domain